MISESWYKPREGGGVGGVGVGGGGGGGGEVGGGGGGGVRGGVGVGGGGGGGIQRPRWLTHWGDSRIARGMIQGGMEDLRHAVSGAIARGLFGRGASPAFARALGDRQSATRWRSDRWLVTTPPPAPSQARIEDEMEGSRGASGKASRLSSTWMAEMAEARRGRGSSVIADLPGRDTDESARRHARRPEVVGGPRDGTRSARGGGGGGGPGRRGVDVGGGGVGCGGGVGWRYACIPPLPLEE